MNFQHCGGHEEGILISWRNSNAQYFGRENRIKRVLVVLRVLLLLKLLALNVNVVDRLISVHSTLRNIMADDIVLPIPNLTLPQHQFTLAQPSLSHLHDDARKALLAGIEKDGE